MRENISQITTNDAAIGQAKPGPAQRFGLGGDKPDNALAPAQGLVLAMLASAGIWLLIGFALSRF